MVPLGGGLFLMGEVPLYPWKLFRQKVSWPGPGSLDLNLDASFIINLQLDPPPLGPP